MNIQYRNLLRVLKQSLRHSPRYISRYLIHGLIIIIPLAVTLWLLVWFFNLIDGLLGSILEWVFGRPIPGLGFLIMFLLVILIGFLGARIGRSKLFTLLESRIISIPIIGTVYGSARQILNSFTDKTTEKFLEVVLMEFPRKGIYTVGLVTSELKDRDGKIVLHVFIPTAPNPTSGFLQIVSESDVIRTPMSVDDAMKLIISAGKVSPGDIADMINKVPVIEGKKTD